MWFTEKKAEKKRVGVNQCIYNKHGMAINLEPIEHLETGEPGYWLESRPANFKGWDGGGYAANYGNDLETRMLWINCHPLDVWAWLSGHAIAEKPVRWESWEPKTKRCVDSFLLKGNAFYSGESQFINFDRANPVIADSIQDDMGIMFEDTVVWWKGIPGSESKDKRESRFMIYWKDRPGQVNRDVFDNELYISWETH